MNGTVGKTPAGKTKTITDQRDLILWLAETAKASEPQVDVPIPMIRLFDTVASKFADTGFLDPPWNWSEWLSEKLPAMYSPRTERCSAKVIWLATNCYAEFIDRRERLQADYFIEALASATLGEVPFSQKAYLVFTRKGRETRISSIAEFHSLHGFDVRVTVQKRVPKAAKITSRWLKDL